MIFHVRRTATEVAQRTSGEVQRRNQFMRMGTLGRINPVGSLVGLLSIVVVGCTVLAVKQNQQRKAFEATTQQSGAVELDTGKLNAATESIRANQPSLPGTATTELAFESETKLGEHLSLITRALKDMGYTGITGTKKADGRYVITCEMQPAEGTEDQYARLKTTLKIEITRTGSGTYQQTVTPGVECTRTHK